MVNLPYFVAIVRFYEAIIILKIGKLKSVGGSINSQCGEDQQSTQRQSTLLILWEGRSTVNAERINSQLSLSCEKAIASVDPGGGINSQCGGDQ